MNNTEQCKTESSWKRLGEFTFKLPKYVYRVPCIPGSKMIDHLGVVKQRADGRWNWWRSKTNCHPTWNGEGQGVCPTQVTAMDEVLLGWETEDLLQATRDFQEPRELTPEQAHHLRKVLKGDV